MNEGVAPAITCREMMADGRQFSRLITYAGSEFVCMSHGEGNRGAFYENILRADAGKFYKAWCHHRGMWPEFLASEHCTKRRDWRLHEGQRPVHYDRTLQPQNLRVGRYFTLLDFCRSEEGLRQGVGWVPPVKLDSARVRYARMVAEILDPVVAAVGRVCVTGGLARPGLCDDPRHGWLSGEGRVEFLPPQGVAGPDVRRALRACPHVREVEDREHAAGTEVRLTFGPFEPARSWSSLAPT